MSSLIIEQINAARAGDKCTQVGVRDPNTWSDEYYG